MNPLAIFTRRVRGFRIIDIAAVMVILVTALGSYAFKTSAGAEDADATNVETQILNEQKRIRLLDAEIARLDDPARIETLSTQYLGLAAIGPKQEIAAADLAHVVAHIAATPPTPPATPVLAAGPASPTPSAPASGPGPGPR